MIKRILKCGLSAILSDRKKPSIAESRPGHRISGKWAHHDIERLAESVRGLQGDFAEIGVYRGEAFEKVVRMAEAQGKTAHAFDSFCGMNVPSEHDGNNYSKGKFDIGGPDAFVKIMNEKGISEGKYKVWAGYIPDCFVEIPESLKFSFVILDVDHYEPTVEALRWVWPRISPFGILALDDFIPTHTALATLAIKEFLRYQSDFDIVNFFNNQLILRKLT